MNKKFRKGATYTSSFLNFIVNLTRLKGAAVTLKNTPEPIRIVRLRKIILEGMDTCDNTLVKKFFRICRDYMKAYENGHICKDVDAAVMEYKSHRSV